MIFHSLLYVYQRDIYIYIYKLSKIPFCFSIFSNTTSLECGLIQEIYGVSQNWGPILAIRFLSKHEWLVVFWFWWSPNFETPPYGSRLEICGLNANGGFTDPSQPLFRNSFGFCLCCRDGASAQPTDGMQPGFPYCDHPYLTRQVEYTMKPEKRNPQKDQLLANGDYLISSCIVWY